MTRRFGELIVLDGVTFTVMAGQVTAMVDANGSGKTTLLRCVIGADRPDEGEVRVEGARALVVGAAAAGGLVCLVIAGRPLMRCALVPSPLCRRLFCAALAVTSRSRSACTDAVTLVPRRATSHSCPVHSPMSRSDALAEQPKAV